MPADDGAFSFEADLALLISASKEAGEVALGFFRRSPANWEKDNNSPVSEADIAVDRLLTERLLAARPDYGWLSEEAADSGARLTRRRSFVVDPIDGTREFLAGGPAWTISLAVVEGGRPVAAALYAPALGQLFEATKEGGARLGGQPIRVSGRKRLEGARLSGPKSLFRGFAAGSMPFSVRYYASLAYRIALVAAGRLDGAAAKGFSKDWDLAAADLLVHEAGGSLTDVDGDVPRYDRADISHKAIIAATPGIRRDVVQLVASALVAAR